MAVILISKKIDSGSSSSRSFANYLIDQNENEEKPQVVYGDVNDVIRNDQRSRLHGHKSSNCHFMLTSLETLTAKQMELYVKTINSAFKIDPKTRPGVLVKHEKKREDNAGSEFHFHYAVAYTDIKGKALNFNDSYLVNEYVSRKMEHALGYEFCKGAHNKAAFNIATKFGDTELAASIKDAGLMEGFRAEAAYDSQEKAAAKRVGVSIPELKKLFEAAGGLSMDKKIKAIAKIAFENGLDIRNGDKKNVVGIFKKGTFIKSASRWSKISKEDTKRVIEEVNRSVDNLRAAAERKAARNAESDNSRGSDEQDRQDQSHRSKVNSHAELATRSIESIAGSRESEPKIDGGNGELGGDSLSTKRADKNSDRTDDRADRSVKQDALHNSRTQNISAESIKPLIDKMQLMASWNYNKDTIQMMS